MPEVTSTFAESDAEKRATWWRTILGEYPTGVSIISALDTSGNPQGLVVGTFTAVSLDPPLIAFMPMRTSRSYQAIADCDHFRVNVLGSRHEELCRSFAGAPPEERFAIGSWEMSDAGIPHLTDSVVWFECSRTQTIEAGDHDIVLGKVNDLGFGEGISGMPMLFLKGGYGSFTIPHLEFNVNRHSKQLRLAEEVRPIISQLAEEVGATVSMCSLTKDHVVVLSAANFQSDTPRHTAVGSSFPMAAPLGAVFVAWDSGSRLNMWKKAGRELGFEDDGAAMELLERVRARGYAMSLGPAMAERFEEVTSDPRSGRDQVEQLWKNIVSDHELLHRNEEWASHVTSIQVPIFGASTETELALVVSGFSGRSETQIEELANRCKSIAAGLTERTGGIAPVAWG